MKLMLMMYAALGTLMAFGETVKIRLLEGERWWGGTVGGGWRSPGSQQTSRQRLSPGPDIPPECRRSALA